MEVHRGEVFYADLSPVVGSEQGASGRCSSCRTRSATATAHRHRGGHYIPAGQSPPAHPYQYPAADTGLAKDSVVLLEQIRTLDKHRLRERAGQITPEDQKRVDQALDVSLGLDAY